MKDCCDMKGFLSFTVLRLISKRNMSGQDIADELERRKGSRPSPGTIYPVLKSLSENEWIEEIKEGGREKKYRITEKGMKEVKLATEKFVLMFDDMCNDFKKVR